MAELITLAEIAQEPIKTLEPDIYRDKKGLAFRETADIEEDVNGPEDTQPDYASDLEEEEAVIPQLEPVSRIPGELQLTQSQELLRNYLLTEGFAVHNIEPYDHWLTKKAEDIISSVRLRLPSSGNSFDTVRFEKLRIKEPTHSLNGRKYTLTPQYARQHGLTYGCQWEVSIVQYEGNYFPGAKVIDRRDNVLIGTVPLILKSRKCVLHGKSRTELKELGEDPDDPGGYFIVAGVEKVILSQEQLAVNRILLMDYGAKGVRCRVIANTKRGTLLTELVYEPPLDNKKLKTPIVKLEFSTLRKEQRVKSNNEMPEPTDVPDPESTEVPEVSTESQTGTNTYTKNKDKQFESINVIHIYLHYSRYGILGIQSIEDVWLVIARFIRPERVRKCKYYFLSNMAYADQTDTDFEFRKILKLTDPNADILLAINDLLDNDMLPHLNKLIGPDGESKTDSWVRIVTAKCNMISIMTARHLEYLAGYRELDIKDDWSRKRLVGPDLMKQLMRNAWRKTTSIVQGAIDAEISTKARDLGTIATRIRESSIITDSFRSSFITSKWGIKMFKVKKNITATLVRDSVIATLAHIGTVDVAIDRTDHQLPLRLVQMSQYGFIDATSTPEGENCGIVKAICITTKVSLDRNDSEIIRLLIGDTDKLPPWVYTVYEDYLAYLNKEPVYYPTAESEPKLFYLEGIDPTAEPKVLNQVIINAKFIGWGNAKAIRMMLIKRRRTRDMVDIDVSVVIVDKVLYIDTTPCRPIRPLLIVDPESQQLMIDKLGLRQAPISELLRSGAMEYLSPWEQEAKYTKLASSVSVIEERKSKLRSLAADVTRATSRVRAVERALAKGIAPPKRRTGEDYTLEEAASLLTSAEEALATYQKNQPYSHCEIDPMCILGISAATIPYIAHNQAPRNTYQVSMGKQAVGIFHLNHKNRLSDGKIKVLISSQRPMVETTIYKLIGLDDRAQSQNVILAFLAFPYTEEDALVFKKEFVDNGGFRMYKYIVYKTIVNDTGDTKSELAKPEPREDEPVGRYKHIGPNGLPMVGAYIRSGECVIGKVQRRADIKGARNESVLLKIGEEGVVDKVVTTCSSEDGAILVTVKLRIMRAPESTDKYAPRNAQKTTIGIVLPAAELPRTAEGLVPDIICNPAQIPSRMTVSYPYELYEAKYGALAGKRINASAFMKPNLDADRASFRYYNYDEFGYEDMYSGTSGEKMAGGKVFVGLVSLQPLKHHGRDKIQARSRGALKSMSRQPLKGRGQGGGIRFGEMERDSAISHGASATTRERMCFVSDASTQVFCRGCGSIAVDTEDKAYPFKCPRCSTNSQFGKATLPYSYIVLSRLLAAPGINLHPEFSTNDEYRANLIGQRSVENVTFASELDRIAGELDEAEAIYDEPTVDPDYDPDDPYGY